MPVVAVCVAPLESVIVNVATRFADVLPDVSKCFAVFTIRIAPRCAGSTNVSGTVCARHDVHQLRGAVSYPAGVVVSTIQ